VSKKKSTQWEVAVEKPAYNLTIFKLHCGKLTLKIYTKGERVLIPEGRAVDLAADAACVLSLCSAMLFPASLISER
jgi:hypothetical protein